jgi:hypothetical protein
MEQKIKSIIDNFIKSMNKWEKYCNEVDELDISIEQQEGKQYELLKAIFDQYCTIKGRKKGRLNIISYGDEGSYDYDPKEELVTNIEFESKKAKVYTFRENPLEERFCYLLLKNHGEWKIDSKKILKGGDWKPIEI